MKPVALTILATFILAAADAPKADKEGLEGTWVIEEGTKNGKTLAPGLLKSLRITFAGDKIILRSAGQKRQGTFALAPTKKPAEITITYADGKTMPSKGIYSLASGRLFLCFAEPGMERPTSFKPTKGEKCERLVLGREKEKA